MAPLPAPSARATAARRGATDPAFQCRCCARGGVGMVPRNVPYACAREHAHLAAALHLPQPRGLVPGRGHHPPPVRTERGAMHHCVVAQVGPDLPVACRWRCARCQDTKGESNPVSRRRPTTPPRSRKGLASCARRARPGTDGLATWTARVPATAVAPGETCNPCHGSPADPPKISRLGFKLNGSWLGFGSSGHPVWTEMRPGDPGSLIRLIDRLRKRYRGR
jgi:hypothetical protein